MRKELETSEEEACSRKRRGTIVGISEKVFYIPLKQAETRRFSIGTPQKVQCVHTPNKDSNAGKIKLGQVRIR
jgi:hypothetical protein